MSRKHSSYKDNVIVYCHLSTRNLASFSVRQLFDGLTHRWMSSPRFPFLKLLNCPPNMCGTLNPLDQLHKKWILRIIIKKTSFVYCYWTVLTPIPLSIWTAEAPSKMTTLIPSAKSFTWGPNVSKPVSSFTIDMRHIRHQPPPPPTHTHTRTQM